MSQSTLKYLRMITPGFVIIAFVTLCGLITGYWTTSIPSFTEISSASLIVVVPAGIYYLTPLRDRANRRYFEHVTENLRSGLLEVAGFKDHKEVFSWKAIRGVFFKLVDCDDTLKSKASLAYFNGYIWTTLADIRSMAICFLSFGIVVLLFDEERGLVLTVTLLVIWYLSHLGSRQATRRHIEIGKQQLEIIEHEYRERLRERLAAIWERHLTSCRRNDSSSP